MSNSSSAEKPYPVFGGNGVRGYVDFYEYEKSQAIVTCRGNGCGLIQFLPPKSTITNSSIAFELKDDSVEMEFLYYWAKNADFSEVTSGSAQPQITIGDISSKEILLPPLPEQKAIAEVLTSLDDKIDLLHKQNKTLEQLAETVFEECIEGKDFDGSVSQLISIQNGYAFKSSDFKEVGNFGVLKIKNISSGVININQTDFVEDPLSLEMSKKFSVKSGDILIGMTGAEIGKLGVVPKTDKFLYLNQRVGLLREKYEGAKYLAYIHLKSEFGQDYIDNAATGSAQPNISGVGIEECAFPILTESQIKEYSNQIAPFYEKIVFNLGQIQSLEKVRDQLLPKLMSGEIRLN
jgi:type I restriction enzyme S subunit